MFVIRPGIYNIPELGKRIDTRNELPKEALLELYLCKSFPFITITKKAIPLLKKQKYSAKQIVALIMKAKTADEVNWLLEVNATKAVKTIAETKINSLET